MKRYITDLEGKQIEVTDIDKGIQQASMFSKFDIHFMNQKSYWEDMLNKLKELKKVIEAEPIPEPIKDDVKDTVPLWVKEIRLNFINSYKSNLLYNTHNGHKSFVKNGRNAVNRGETITRLYSIHSCVRAEQNVRILERLEVGETWHRGFGSPNITRIF